LLDKAKFEFRFFFHVNKEILQFQLDRSIEVKKIVITFIEEACKRDMEAIFNVVDNFRYLLFDENVNVQKRAYLSMINIYKNTLKVQIFFFASLV
jgi:symplekin